MLNQKWSDSMKYNIMITGAAGHGINLTEKLLINYLTSRGLHFHAYKDYMSRVRGGTNFVQILVSDSPVKSHDSEIDLLIALTQDGLDSFSHLLKDSGTVIMDATFVCKQSSSTSVISLDFKNILSTTANPKGISVIALGAISKAIGVPRNELMMLLPQQWPMELKQKNLETTEKSYDLVQQLIELPNSSNKGYLIASGNQAAAFGAMAAGLSFYAAYPMAPSTGVMNVLMSYDKQFQMIVEQVEDEIAAANAIIGASASGVRSMTSTSGGGFSLMAEAIGLAAVAEVPMVVLDVQRPGPATGMATRTEQSDLNFVLNASQGEFARIILSFRDVEDAFYQTFRAFNLSDKYRVPVILLSDQYLADAMATIPSFKLEDLAIEQHVLTELVVDYKHHNLESPIQKRAIPGWTETIVMNDSHEHDEYASVTEESENRIQMNHRRMEKLMLIKEDILEPVYTGSEAPEIVLLAWGSTTAQVEAAVEQLMAEQSHNIGALLFNDLYPLPTEKLMAYQAKNVQFITVEGNYQAQLAQLIARETGIWIEDSILKFDGRQMDPHYIIDSLKELI